MENHFYHIRWPPLNLTIFIIYVRNCVVGVTPMLTRRLRSVYVSTSILEYGYIVWSNCTQQGKQDIEKIKIEAARIVTGETKLVSINSLYEETGWDTLETRRKNHKLTLFFKLINDLAPQYLSDLVPATIDSSSNYNLRSSNNFNLVNARTSLYFNYFLPSAVCDWNNIPDDHRNVDTVIAFKNVLSRDKPIVPKHYLFGNKKEQILHTRLRTNHSVSNYDLYLINIIDSPLCRCNTIETVFHFFLDCLFVCFCCFTAMVIAGRSVHLTTLFPGQAWTSG